MAADGSSTAIHTAYCPARASATAVDVCRTCAHAHNVTEDVVVCSPPGVPESVEQSAGAVAVDDVTCVRGDVPGLLLIPLTRKAPWHVPVVDASDRFIGFVTSQTLASRPWPWRLLSITPAEELVFGRFLRVSVSDPLPIALRLMAHRGARAVALVDNAGVLQGVLSDIDALRNLKKEPTS